MHFPEYLAPNTLDEALHILGDTSDSIILAGGTLLNPRLHFGEIQPRLLLDIRHLPIHAIYLKGRTLCLGAGVTIAQVANHVLVRQHFPALAQACDSIGSPAIRARSTLGGNLAACLREADSIPALLIYDAQLLVAKRQSKRLLPLTEFYTPSGCVLEAGEMVTEIRIPVPKHVTAACFLKFGNRRGMAASVVNVAVRLSQDRAHSICDARIAIGAYAERPFRFTAAEEILNGCMPENSALNSLRKSVIDLPPASADVFVGENFRKMLATTLLERALQVTLSGLHRRVAYV